MLYAQRSPTHWNSTERTDIFCAGAVQCIVQGVYEVVSAKLNFLLSLVNIKLNFWYNVCSLFFSTGCVNYAPPGPTVFG